MIKPESLWGLFKTCDDSKWLGDICRVLGRQDVELDFGQRQMVATIERDSGWMDERIEAKRERDRERKRRSRGIQDVTRNPRDKTESENSVPTNQPAIQPTSQPKEGGRVNAAHAHVGCEGVDRPDLSTVVTVATTAMGVTEAFARWWHAEMTARDWRTTDGRRIDGHNWRANLKAWFNRAKPSELASINTLARKAIVRKFKVEDWVLCAERCSRFKDGKCANGICIPPQFALHPHAPEECRFFNATQNKEEQ